MNNKKSAFLVMTASLMLLAACGPTGEDTTIVTGDYMPGATAKLTYNSLIATTFDSLNYHVSQDASNSRHIANFIDGLLTNDQYGRLVKALATKVEKNSDYTQFTFTIRENVPWMTYQGKQYVSVSTGEPQFVCADDFITTAKSVLDVATESDTMFMVTMFIEGTVEYVSYTALAQQMTNETFAKKHQTPKSQADWMTQWMKTNYPAQATTVNPDNLEDIKSFKRVGITKTSEGKLVYKLTQSAPFFPTMLTYSPFLPTNADFLARHTTDFGSGYDSILYDGPFYLATKPSATAISYTKNKSYYDADKVHVNKVNFEVYPSDATASTIRNYYENGLIDGFTLDSKDTEGWKKYIEGPDGDGTIEDPYDPLVNSRYYDNVDSSWMHTFNVNRANSIDGGTSAANQKSDLSDADIHNTNIAMKISEVRETLVKGTDFAVFNKRHGDLELEQEQYQLNTFIPKGFVFDDENKDYVDYYYNNYATNEGMTVEEAKAKLAPGQYEGVNLTDSEIATVRANAKKAIDFYNVANPTAQISLPIKVENMSLGGLSSDSLLQDERWANSFNARVNGCTLKQSLVSETYPLCEGGKYPLFELTNNVNFKSQTNLSAASQSAWSTMNIWGWTADYGDPMSYLNCYTTGGDMAFTTGTEKAVPNYKINAAGTGLVYEADMLAEYNALVSAASAQTQSYSIRYNTFAQAEYKLLNELFIIQPLYNYGQGWRASVSKALGYDAPTAAYGLAADKLTGIWVLYGQPVSKEQRTEMYERFTQKKQEAIADTGMIAIYD